MNILITGGTGFIGNALVRSLKNKKKYNILIATRNKSNEKRFCQCNLLDLDSIINVTKGNDLVIHLAFSKNYPENIKIAENLVRASKKSEVKKIILISSMSAKRKHPDGYGKTKQKVEKIVKESGLNYTILRPSIIYGEGSTSFDFIIQNIRKVPLFVPIIGTGKYKISPVHINDVVKGILNCISNKKTNNKEYDLPGGEEIYFVDLINVLKKELKINKKNIHVPIWGCNLVAAIAPKLISKENIKNLTEDSLAQISESEKDLNYHPIKFREGIKNGLL